MECLRKPHEQWLELKISGRLNAQSSDQLDRELAELLRDGIRQIRLEMGEIVFISSAGIRILLKYRKELAALHGSLQVVAPSPAVSTVLKLSGLLQLLVADEACPGDDNAPLPTASAVLLEGGSITLYHPAPEAVLSLRTVGSSLPLEGNGFRESYPLPLPADSMAVGLGAFGIGFDDCRSQFGEFMALGGNAMTLPGDGNSPPDFLAGVAEFVPTVQALYALVCQGSFAHFFQFSADNADQPIPFSQLVATARSLCNADCVGLAMIAETDGLVGASLLASPVVADSPPLFTFPQIQDRLVLTIEPEWPHSLAMVCGVAVTGDNPRLKAFVRPLGETAGHGHFHAAALSYRALPGGVLELAPTVTGLLETQNLQGLVHLVNDTRPINGIGESHFLRGTLWCAPAILREERS